MPILDQPTSEVSRLPCNSTCNFSFSSIKINGNRGINSNPKVGIKPQKNIIKNNHNHNHNNTKKKKKQRIMLNVHQQTTEEIVL